MIDLSARAPAAVALAIGLIVACNAGEGAPSTAAGADESTSTGAAAGESGDATGPGESGDATGDPGPAPLPDPFELDRENIKLLPFKVRFNKLQQLVGLPAEDPTFDVLRARRYELGDYDYASGVNPDLTWTASKISVWLAAVLPVCRSQALLTRFPAFPDDLPDFLAAAFGTIPSADQLDDFESLLGDANLDDAARHDSVCAVVLTSLEFVAR